MASIFAILHLTDLRGQVGLQVTRQETGETLEIRLLGIKQSKLDLVQYVDTYDVCFSYIRSW